MGHALSRREFVALAVSGTAAMWGIDARSISADGDTIAQTPVLQGLPQLDGQLLVDRASRTAFATDYGNVFHRTPAAVLRPRSVRDVLQIVRYANERSMKVAIRGDGHSQYGQTQAAGGIVIDSRSLRGVQASGPSSVDAQPGAYWADVAGATLGRQATPPVYPATCMMLTVGGTLSVGGIGSTSHHFGAQIDNVLELDVVTGDGQLITCSATHESELFNLVLGGSGQCGIIVRARLPLMRAPSEVLIQQLEYDDLDAYLADQLRMAQDGRYDQLRGGAAQRRGRWTFIADVGKYFSAPNVPDMNALHRGLHFTSATPPRLMTYGQSLFRYEAAPWTLLAARRAFITAFLPATQVKAFVSTIMSLPPERSVPPRSAGPTGLTFYALNARRFRRPMLPQPDEEQAFVVWLFRSVPANDRQGLARLQDSNQQLLALMTSLGGKRYSPYCGTMSSVEWATHFGPDVWRRLSLAKEKYDPNNVLSPGPEMFAAGPARARS